MKTRIIAAIGIVLVILLLLAGIKTVQIHKLMTSKWPQPVESVTSAIVHAEKWQGTLSAIGSVDAIQGVMITPEIDGTVREIGFTNGAMVAQGDLLVKMDTSTEDAQLRAQEADVELDKVNLDRAHALRTANAISQSDLDSAEATWKQAVATADSLRATIGKKTIRAPFAGQAGIRQVNLGQYLDKGKPVVSLQALSQVYGDFSLPQQDLARLKPGMKVHLITDAFPDKDFEGTLTAINPDLDPNTRSVNLQATFDNPDELLRPGMFARMEVLLPEEQDVLVIPATSILSAPFGDSVYVIETDTATNGTGGLVVRQQFVRTGMTHGDFISVETGLQAGQKVVKDGVFKLRNKASVIENNDMAPKPEKSPNPANS
jgi:membrane fusion protein, multidrug efflux system